MSTTPSVVAVAGAGGPAGRAVVHALAAAGTTVAAADASQERLTETASSAPAGAVVDTAVVDLLDADATRTWVDGVVAEHGRLDGLVHLVGGWRGGKGLDDAALGHWGELEPLLVRTVQHTSLASRDALLASGRGRYALVSAAGASRPTAGNAAYAAAKAAAEAWTLALADSFERQAQQDAPGPLAAAAGIVVVKALVDDAMRAAKPEAAFAGYTDVADLARSLLGLWNLPAAEVNGTRVWLTPQP